MPDIAILPPIDETPAPLPGVFVSDFFTQPLGYAVRRTRGTQDWLITFTTAGQGRYQMHGEVVRCQAGDVVLLQPHTLHDYATAGTEAAGVPVPWEFYWAHFIPRSSWLGWLALPVVQPGLHFYSVRDVATRQRIEAALCRMVKESAAKGPYQEELAQNALEEALILIAQEISAGAQRTVDERIDAIQKYLELHYNQPISLSTLAGLVKLSPWRLSHLYKAMTGRTIVEDLSRLRLRQAARLLAFTSRKIEEIAADVGYQSPYHFSKVFKKYYGISPSNYRENVNG